MNLKLRVYLSKCKDNKVRNKLFICIRLIIWSGKNDYCENIHKFVFQNKKAMIISDKMKDIAHWANEYAIKKGGTQCRISLTVSTDNSIEYRNRQIDKLQQSTENKLYVEVFIEGRYGAFSTNRLSDKRELEVFINEGIESTKLLAPDICRVLPDDERYYDGKSEDLGLFDENLDKISANEKIDLAKRTIEEIYDRDERIISVSSYLYDGISSEYMITSNGFEAITLDSACSLGAEVSLKTIGDARPEAYWSESEIFWNKLPKSDIASKALERAIGKIGQTKIKSGKYSVIFDNRTSARLLSPLISAMYGSALQQKNSFLLDKLGDTITSSCLSIKDKPHLKGNFGARLFDGEGVATKNMTIIENGRLNMYFIDTYNSLKMNTAPTISSPSIFEVEFGTCDFPELLHKMFNGVWITGFNGGNCNSTTGDFSFGIEGFRIEQGSIAQPISEMNITGNILDLWRNLAEVGNDPRPNTSWRIPSLVFNDVNLSGM